MEPMIPRKTAQTYAHNRGEDADISVRDYDRDYQEQ